MTTELVRRAQHGDHAAFERLAAASIDRLYAVAYRVLRDAAAAEDAVQDCLVRAWRDVRGLRDVDRWDAWMYRLLRNACHDEQRRRQRRPVTVGMLSIDAVDDGDDIARIDTRDQVARGFLHLSVEHRMALALHYHLGLGAPEIARLLDIPEGTATSRIHYGTRALRAALESDLRSTPAVPGVLE
jgi:RNA polymerase sigma-70 factor, ECF subfamily